MPCSVLGAEAFRVVYFNVTIAETLILFGCSME